MTKKDSKTKKKSIVARYYLALYDVWLVIANEHTTVEDLKKRYVFSDGVVLNDEITGGCATTSTCRDIKTDAYVVLVKYNGPAVNKELNPKTDFINTISHEATHVALDIYELIGQKVCTCSPEPFCYLVGWATERIYETLKQIK